MDNFRELIISKNIIDEVILHCKQEFPYEACGILAGKGNIVNKIYKTTNIEKTSFSYQIDPKEQFSVMKEMRNNNLKMLCIYHSHPYSVPYPSAKDVRLAFYDDVFYMIIGIQELIGNTFSDIKNGIKIFIIKEGMVNEINYKIINEDKPLKNL